MGRLGDSFHRVSGDYDRGRPRYPAAAVAAMLEGLPEAPEVVDIGAGTGQLAEAILAAGRAGRGGGAGRRDTRAARAAPGRPRTGVRRACGGPAVRGRQRGPGRLRRLLPLAGPRASVRGVPASATRRREAVPVQPDARVDRRAVGRVGGRDGRDHRSALEALGAPAVFESGFALPTCLRIRDSRSPGRTRCRSSCRPIATGCSPCSARGARSRGSPTTSGLTSGHASRMCWTATGVGDLELSLHGAAALLRRSASPPPRPSRRRSRPPPRR